MKRLIVICLVLSLAAGAQAAVNGVTLEYKHGDVTCEGYLAWDDAAPGKRPGILVIHDWFGAGPFVKEKAEKLAGMGFVALAADIYGRGVRPKDAQEAQALAGKWRSDRPMLRERAAAGLKALLADVRMDPARVVAMGYCFGGGTALELARSGAPLAGVVAFHGTLDTPVPADGRNIKGKVLVLHGADDPFVPMTQVGAFMDEMRQAKTDWQMVFYGGAVHAFAVPAAGDDNSKGAAYNEKADRRSWEAFMTFLSEVFGEPQ